MKLTGYVYNNIKIRFEYFFGAGGAGGGVCGADPVTTDSRLTKTDQGRRTLLAIKYILNDVRKFRYLLNLPEMLTTIFRFDLNILWM